MNDMITRALIASDAAGEAYLTTMPTRLDQRPDGWRRELATVRARAALLVTSEPLFAAEEALEALRRCHGTDVQSLCYPAVNLVRDACDQLRRAEQASVSEIPNNSIQQEQTGET